MNGQRTSVIVTCAGGAGRRGHGRRGDGAQVGGDHVFNRRGGAAALRRDVAGDAFSGELQEELGDGVVDLRIERGAASRDPFGGRVLRGRAAQRREQVARQQVLEERAAELPPFLERAGLLQRGARADVGGMAGALHRLVGRRHLDVERGDLGGDRTQRRSRRRRGPASSECERLGRTQRSHERGELHLGLGLAEIVEACRPVRRRHHRTGWRDT